MISIEGNAPNVSFDMNKITSQKSFNNMITLYCSNFMLINVTNINPDISNIYFTNLYLREIELHYFKNLNKLIHLSVQTNNINNIKNYTFMDLNELIYLVLSKNNITHIESGAFAGLYYLKILNLAYNSILVLHTDTFNIMNRLGNSLVKNITFINLYTNRLKVIKSRLFVFDKMESIDLSYNQITTIENNAFSINNIDSILLLGNRLSSIDEFVFNTLNIKLLLDVYNNTITCNCELRWIKNHKKMLNHLNRGNNGYIKCHKDTQLLTDYINNLTCNTSKGIYIIYIYIYIYIYICILIICIEFIML